MSCASVDRTSRCCPLSSPPTMGLIARTDAHWRIDLPGDWVREPSTCWVRAKRQAMPPTSGLAPIGLLDESVQARFMRFCAPALQGIARAAIKTVEIRR